MPARKAASCRSTGPGSAHFPPMSEPATPKGADPVRRRLPQAVAASGPSYDRCSEDRTGRCCSGNGLAPQPRVRPVLGRDHISTYRCRHPFASDARRGRFEAAAVPARTAPGTMDFDLDRDEPAIRGPDVQKGQRHGPARQWSNCACGAPTRGSVGYLIGRRETLRY